MEKLHVENVKTTSGLDVGSAGMQGWRLEMEVLTSLLIFFNKMIMINELQDSHIISDIPSLKSHTLLSIFDGQV